MELEYSIWNITDGWQPLKATTLDEATRELGAMGPYSEEAQVRDKDTGKVYSRRKKREIHWGP